MADSTKTLTVRNGGSADVTADAGAASQTSVYDRSDENIVIRVENVDANTAGITVQTNGYGGEQADNLVIEVAQNEVKYIGVLESMYYKAPSDGKVTIQVLDPDGTAFSGTVTNVNFEVIELPKGIND